MCIRNTTYRNYADSTPAGRGEGVAMAIVTISVKLETDDKIVDMIEKLSDRNIDVDVDVER